MLGIILLSNLAQAQSNATLYEAQTRVCYILQQFYDLLIYLASGIGVLMIVIQGLLWVTSGGDNKKRLAVKTSIVHVIVGLIIVSISLSIVNMAIPEWAACTSGW